MDWTEETIARLRGYWTEGHSTAEIGRRLGVTKNAVVGKAHRLDLPARPSPIRRDGQGQARRQAPRRVAGPTLPPLNSTTSPISLPAPPVARQEAPRVVAPVPVRPVPVELAPRQPSPPRPYARTLTCCWPIGEPGTKSFRFCDGGAAPGKPYCVEHASVAYVRVRDRREDAA